MMMMMNNKSFIWAVLAMVGLMSCGERTEKPKEDNTEYAVTSPVLMDTVYTKEYVAQIRSVKNIQIRSQEKGYLQKIFVDEGQFVKAGQPLFKIMSSLNQTEVSKAQAESKSAEIELGNTKMLVDKDIISKKEQDLAKAKLDQANAELSAARLHLGFTLIRAPFAGYIDRIPNKLGSLIDEGDSLTNLSDNSEIYAYFNVGEPEYLQYQMDVKDRADTHVNLKMANDELFPELGKVEVIESDFDPETGNIAFRAQFPNPKQWLKNGETGKILMKMPMKNALVIPQKATYEIQDKVFVFILNGKNELESREITIAAEFPDLYVVKSGLKVNEKFLLEGAQSVKDGQKIKPKFQDPQQVITHLRMHAE